ncbi:MAG: tRNA (N6-isopentenyl adenosine(37)-C2)-methylthiotransferase MiaB [Planctomycetes bacterium]|nr:tRNA (N6-isopentenyl adenosine(37)-C2)-methylthiotransferase MiaB [Planctomycetota bacterium]
MRVFLETFGCQMNKLDSELVLGRLRAAGHELVGRAAEADVVLYNTCSVRDHAEAKVAGRLGEQTRRKRSQDRPLIVGVLGCMAQRLGTALTETFPGVDIVCGPSEIDRLVELIDQAAARHTPRVAVAPPRPGRPREADADANRRLEALDLSRPAGGNGAQAFVRIQRGCDNFCTYCIVPYVRGSEQSRDPDAIVEEIRRLAGGGVREVTLLGQTVSHYRYSDGGRTTLLADLLERIEPIAGIERVRFVTSYPGRFDRRILQAMRDLPKVCEYLHVPAQSGSDRMLAAMRRRYTRAEYLELIDEARALVPGVAIAGDFIVGFPGETEEDFDASADLIRRVGYKNCFIFKYSPREGTAAAASMADDVPAAVKKRRNNALLDVQNAVSLAHHEAMIGTTRQVLVEGVSPRSKKQPVVPPTGQLQLQGRTRGDHIVAFNGPAACIGQLVNVRITSATALAMRGQRVENGRPFDFAQGRLEA